MSQEIKVVKSTDEAALRTVLEGFVRLEQERQSRIAADTLKTNKSEEK